MAKASDLFVRALEAEGVEFVFGIPGEENLDVVESLRSSSIIFGVAVPSAMAAWVCSYSTTPPPTKKALNPAWVTRPTTAMMNKVFAFSRANRATTSPTAA